MEQTQQVMVYFSMFADEFSLDAVTKQLEIEPTESYKRSSRISEERTSLGNLMEITLIRHGKSKHIENNIVTCKEFVKWVEKYDNSGVFEEKDYPSETLKKIATASILITSNLTRSVESANLIIQNRNTRVVTDVLFRETELPVPSRNLKFKMRPNSWAVILRCLWFCGYARQNESLAKAKQRAKKASEQLVKYAEEHKSAVLVGHGFFNRLIAVELKKMGWKGKRKATAKHWHCTTYSYDE